MIITNKVNLDLKRPSWISAIDAVQDDKYSRNLELTLTCDGSPWAIPQDATPVIHYSKANGSGGMYDTLPDGTQAWSIQNNVLTLALAPQVLTTAGMVSLSVVLIRGQQQLSTFSLMVNVHPAVGANIAASEPYFNVPGWLPAPASGAAGQFLRIGAADENGHVEQVEAVDGCLPVNYTEPGGAGTQHNPASESHPLWQQWNARLAFGMDIQEAPVPFLVDGQLLVDGTIIAHNSGDMTKNRWGFHVLEAYGTDNHSRVTMLLDKHQAEASDKPSAELYFYTGADHTAQSYGNTKLGSDVAFHSFCFDRDKLTAYGEIDSKMPITLARISLSQDLITDYSTVAEADTAYEPEAYPQDNSKCLKFLALRNAEDGAMFYDTDRQKAVCKIGGKWCDLPCTEISDPAYDILLDNVQLDIQWESGVIGAYGDTVANTARIRTVGFLPDRAATITANEGYEFCLLCLTESGVAENNAYFNPNSGSQEGSPTWITTLDISGVSFPGYPKRKIIARRTDLAQMDPSEGVNIMVM